MMTEEQTENPPVASTEAGVDETPKVVESFLKDSKHRFPCLEQPLRVTLHCNGYYVWGLRNGKAICRKHRSERDEFRLEYQEDGSVVVTSHKFGGHLTVVRKVDAQGVATKVLQFVKIESEDEKTNKTNNKTQETSDKTQESEDKEVETKPNEEEKGSDASDTKNEDSAEEKGVEEEEQEVLEPTDASNMKEEDRKWCFIKGAHGTNGVLLQSLSTGEHLAMDERGKMTLIADTAKVDPKTLTWHMDCATGELLFISNRTLNQRIRCDLAGLTSIVDQWKGWEVFRFMEAGHGYVKISSWMHSQWFLCSNAEGAVTCQTHADSLDESGPWCSQWAIEASTEGNGVTIRSKTHQDRLLCVKKGMLWTYHPDDAIEKVEKDDDSDDSGKIEAPKEVAESTTATEEDKVSTSESAGSDSGSKPTKAPAWSNFARNMQTSFKNFSSSRSSQSTADTASEASSSRRSTQEMWNNFSQRMANQSASTRKSLRGLMAADPTKLAIPPHETLIWQLEAAHQQTYYLSTRGAEGGPPHSIGPYPQVTPNLRKTDRFQLIVQREPGKDKNDEEAETHYLYHLDHNQYLCCDEDGKISLNSEPTDDTAWLLHKSKELKGGSSFQSKTSSVFLSYTESESSTDKKVLLELATSESIADREVWFLEPCMPRAVSSEKIKTFALGTSIAVGTTIAMPFALAGIGAVLGAVGAEVGLVANAIAVGLTGAEALASVGAIGATAYIVFRPEENSLTDDHKDDDEAAKEQAWSKRPFSNWRNW